jgi:hypothetical protein
MLKTILTDGHGTDNKAKIDGEGALTVVVHPHPPIDETLQPTPFRAFLTDSAGSKVMKINGGTTNVEFCVRAQPDVDIYIKNIAVVIADASATLSKFGNIAALTNGVEFAWITQSSGSVIIHDALQSNFDFVQLALGQPAFGDGAGAFRAGNVIGTSEGYIPVIDLSATFGLQWGVRLRKGTKDKICFTVKDDCTGVDRFDAVAYGIQI